MAQGRSEDGPHGAPPAGEARHDASARAARNEASRPAAGAPVDPDALLAGQVADALAALGLRARAIHPVTVLNYATWRSAFRVELDDGRTIKARTWADDAAPRWNHEVRRSLDRGFAPTLGAHRSVLLEEWIDGEPLPAGGPDDATLDAAGTLLASLHAIDVAAGAPVRARASTGPWRDLTETTLGSLHERGALREREAEALRGRLRRLDPGAAPFGLVHGDFCGENMLVDRSGRLVVIDNEHLAVDALGLDLGRTWSRWALPARAWARFAAAYAERAADPEPLQTLPFWILVAAVRSASVRLRFDPSRAHPPLGQLRAMAAGGAPAQAAAR